MHFNVYNFFLTFALGVLTDRSRDY